MTGLHVAAGLDWPVLPAWLAGVSLLVALAADRYLGEPRAQWHPVVWMGNYLAWAGAKVQRVQGLPSRRPRHALVFGLGALAWCLGAALVVLSAWALHSVAAALVAQSLFFLWLPGLLLKPMLAWAMLKSEVEAVEHALSPDQGGSLEQGRARLGWLVSRDVRQLSESQVRESAIESLAENLNDSVVAPIFWFVLLGLPGAALYRFANTADAMWGYRGLHQGHDWEWAGKWAARADDVLSWVPARITALGLALVAPVGSLVRLRAEAARTPSPNSGWPMAAMALALQVCLQKPGVYRLNPAGRAPQPADTRRAVVLAARALMALVVLAQAALLCVLWVGAV